MGVRADVGELVAGLALAEYNPDAQGLNGVSGEVTKQVRPFLLQRFGDLLNS